MAHRPEVPCAREVPCESDARCVAEVPCASEVPVVSDVRCASEVPYVSDVPCAPGRPDRREDGGRRDRGQVAIEYLGFLPVLLIVAMAAVQLGLIAYTAQQAGTAARAGARSASLDQGAQAACAAAVSSWLAGGTSCGTSGGGDEVTVTARVDIPSIVPGWDFGAAGRSATMPVDH